MAMLLRKCSWSAKRLHTYWKNSLRYLKSVSPHGSLNSDITKIRNVGIIAHIDAGKTTTTERMLYYSGASQSMGDVHDGNTVTDFMDQERERGISIRSAVVNFSWKDHKVNLVDTPGHIDFTCEVESALRVLDGAILVLDASEGVEAQTLSVWKQALKYNIPQIAFINKMDKNRASFKNSIGSIKEKLDRQPLALQLPVVSNESKMFTGVVDLVKMMKCQWSDGGDGSIYQKTMLDPSKDKMLHEEAYEARLRLLETLADVDEVMGDHYLEDSAFSTISVNQINSAIKRATLSCKVLPVLCGSSLKNKGVQRLLNAIISYLPDPLHHDSIYRDKSHLNPQAALTFAFKIMHDKKKAPITFLRIYSGNLKVGSAIFNATRDCKEKIEKIYEINGNEFESVTSQSPGNIVAVTGLKSTHTGDVLVGCNGSFDEKSFNLVDIPTIQVPEPVYFCSVEPPTLSAQKDLDLALDCLSREDPSLKVKTDLLTGQTVLGGMGELHMEIIKDRILREYGTDVDLGPLQIAYQETLGSHQEVHKIVEKTVGDSKHCVEVIASFYPLEDELKEKKRKKFTLSPLLNSELSKRELRPQYVKAIEDGLADGFSKGPLLGHPITNVHMELHELKTSSRVSLPILSSCIAQCVRETVNKNTAVLLQPVMDIEVFTTANYLGTVLSDLSQRDSIILSVIKKPGQDSASVHAKTPLAKLDKFSTVLRTKTSGMATFNLTLSTYERVPEKTLETLLKSYGIY